MKCIPYLLFTILICAQAKAQRYVIKSIKEFGAKGDGHSNDQEAFRKASAYFNARKGNGKLLIPKAVYIIGRQKFTGRDSTYSFSYTGENSIDLKGCDNMIIEGKPGAVLKYDKGFRIGTFIPATGNSFKHNLKDININNNYRRYQSSVGISINLTECSNIKVTGLKLDGNINDFIFGGNWGDGRNAFEMIHYGIYLIDSRKISISKCNIEKYACDGIYIANRGKQVNTFKITIDKCKVNFCGRNGLSWLGGEDIRVTNSEFSNSGQGLVHESPAAGIDIEVENFSFCRKGYFYNCNMINNMGSGITSGSKANSSDVLFKHCRIASPSYYSVFIDAPAHVFQDCKFYGTVLVWYEAKGSGDAVKFKHCLFDEKYKNKKMYDGNYQLGAEATAVEVDSSVFKSYSTACYYLAAHTKDCSVNNPQKIKVTNCEFYNYGGKDFKLATNVAGMAGFTVFYNNNFFSLPGVHFQNAFNNNCNADAGKNVFHTLK